MRDAMKSSITNYSENPASFAVRDYGENEKKKLLAYMRGAAIYAVAGLVYDCVLGQWQKEENVGYKDDKFMWSEQDVHHVERYNAAVTDEFLSKAVL